jgi:hypothetical protein
MRSPLDLKAAKGCIQQGESRSDRAVDVSSGNKKTTDGRSNRNETVRAAVLSFEMLFLGYPMARWSDDPMIRFVITFALA